MTGADKLRAMVARWRDLASAAQPVSPCAAACLGHCADDLERLLPLPLPAQGEPCDPWRMLPPPDGAP